MEQRAKGSGVIRKLVVSLVLAAVAWFGSGAIGFPHVFQVMFVIYVGLGFLVFLLLDAPPLPRLSGLAAGVALIGFYAVISAAYILGASALPQYDPEIEKGKIEKILKKRLVRVMGQDKKMEDMLQQVKTLQGNTEEVTMRLARFAPTSAVVVGKSARGGAMTVVDRGAEVYDLYECYNCHKIGGKGSVKKRGPILDNIGSFLTVQDIKRKILDPNFLYAKGFEKEHKKGRMPDKYKDLMMEEEIMSLATYLSTLKDTTANTPEPVFVKSNVEHGFTVFGYVRDSSGKTLSGVEVQVMPKPKDGHGAKGKTNESGYYEIFMHMHNENAGATVKVSAQNATKEFVANYDPNDKVTRRQQSLDLVVSAK